MGFSPRIPNELYIPTIPTENRLEFKWQKKTDTFWILLDLPANISAASKWNLSYQTSLLICVYVVITLVFNHDFQLRIWECSLLKFHEIPARAPKASKSHPAMSIGMCSSLPQNTFGYLRLPGKLLEGRITSTIFVGMQTICQWSIAFLDVAQLKLRSALFWTYLC